MDAIRDGLSVERRRLEPELVAIRRTLHRQPELAFAEHRTAALIAQRLRSLGVEPRNNVGGTGVLADLDTGRPGPTLLLRAEMDALPLTEQSGREYGSEVPGCMHACGHDAHVSALLGTAALLLPRLPALSGRLRLLFQPAEEVGAGALAAISDGVLDGVDEALAAHVYTPMPVGVVGVRAGEVAVGADLFELVLDGGGGHSGSAYRRRDAVGAAAQLVTELAARVTERASPDDTLIVTVASIEGGSAANVVASRVIVRGTVRWVDPEVRARALAQMHEVAQRVCGSFRVTPDLRLTATLPVLRCSEGPTRLLGDAATAAGLMVIDPGVVRGSEDFAHVAQRVPTGSIAIGAGGKGCGEHHAPDFDIDERAIGLTAEILARAALARLGPP